MITKMNYLNNNKMKNNQKNKHLMQLLSALFLLISVSSQAHFGSKGPYGGSVSCSLVKETNVYMGTLDGGVYESTNSKLLAWRARPVGLKSGKITALAHTGKYLFAATADSGVFVFTGFVGSDRYWKKANNGIGSLQITSLYAVDSSTVLAGTLANGIYKTTDKGANWVSVGASLLHFEITGFVQAGNRIIHTSDGGMWASDDQGSTWFDFTDVYTDDIKASAISYNSVNHQILISNADGLYTADSADVTSMPMYINAQNGLPAQTMVRAIANDGNNWYIATDKGVFTSSCLSINWTAVNTGLPTNDINSIVYIQNRLLAGTHKEGIYKSPSASIAWIANNTSFNNVQTFSMITGGASTVIAATEKGVFVSNDLANIYKAGNKGLLDSLHVNDLAFSQANLLAATKNAGVFISADTAKTWSPFNSGLGSMVITKIFTNGNEKFVLTSSGHLYRYDGTSWVMDHIGVPSASVITSMAFFGNKMILGVLGKGVYVKSVSGMTWNAFNTGLSDLNVTSLTQLGAKIFAGTDGSGVFVSDTANANWSATSSTVIPHTSLMSLNAGRIQAMAQYGAYVFASYKGGLVASSDNGATWIAGGNQFNLPSFTDVKKISFVTTRVFVTTENNGLYSNALSELPSPAGVADLSAADLSSLDISPNPNRGEFFIHMEKVKANVSAVVIFDMLGKQMQFIPVSKIQQQIAVHTNGIPGVYFVQLLTDKGPLTKRIVIE